MKVIEREFENLEDLFEALFGEVLDEMIEKKTSEKEEKKDFDVKYEYKESDLIKANKKIEELESMKAQLFKENAELVQKVGRQRDEINAVLANQKKLMEENKSLKGGPYNKDFYLSVMSNLGRKIVDEYVLWLNLCKALKLDKENKITEVSDLIYDSIPEE